MLTATAERDRVTQHILRAEEAAARADVSHLDPLRALTRELLLQELANYRAEGRFPKNPGVVPDLTPTFVDAEGTRCAMAHLIELGGQPELVAKIATERNYARVKELADEPLLLAWLDAAGLSVEEAATIQPGYSCTTPAACVCGQGFSSNPLPVPAKAVLQAVVLQNSELQLEQVYGQTSLRVGDKLTYTGPAPVGSKLILGLSESQAAVLAGSSADQLASAALDGSEKFICQPGLGGGVAAPGLTTEAFSQLAFASDCLTEAYKLPGFEAKSCTTARGCSTMTGEPFSLGILLAIAGVLLRRKLTLK